MIWSNSRLRFILAALLTASATSVAAASPSNGVQSAPFNVSAVHFGLRCDDAVKASIVKLLANSINSPEAFYEIARCEGSSSLERREIDTDEMMAFAVRTSPLMDFREPAEDE